MQALINFVKPLLFSFLSTNAVKQLVIDLLYKYSKTTDNKIDDALVEIVKDKLFNV